MALKRVEYISGSEARKNFEATLSKLFRAPKPVKIEKQPKRKTASEEKKS